MRATIPVSYTHLDVYKRQMAMCYLIFVVPSMLADAGMPRESAVAAVIWVTIAITLLMGLWARFPVGVAPGLGITAFFAYYVCGPAGYSWQTGLGAVFISGVFFMLLTVTRVRQMIIDAVPMDLKYAIVVGIGAVSYTHLCSSPARGSGGR